MADVIEIPLSQGQVAFIDAADAWVLDGPKWRALRDPSTRTFYAVRNVKKNGKKTAEKLHRVLLAGELGPRLHVDHIDHDGLNNRRCNLRVATPSENGRNRRAWGASGFKGVYREKAKKKWSARIRVPNASGEGRGRRIRLGCFQLTPEGEREAALAYDAAALKYHGPFATTNKMLGLL